jgi:hypothetical protein
MSIEKLALADVETFLKRLSAAIELDQVYVDALPPERFSIQYDDSMWRSWRRDHRAYIETLLSTAHLIPSAMLKQLTEIAIAHEPAIVEGVLLEQFAEIVSGCSGENFSTAQRFFGWLIEQMGALPKGHRRRESARASVSKWFAGTEPLRIGQDSECGYAQVH